MGDELCFEKNVLDPEVCKETGGEESADDGGENAPADDGGENAPPADDGGENDEDCCPGNCGCA